MIKFLLVVSTLGFNRTFMELKSMTDDRGIHKIVSFNRTFMELKWSLFVISGVCSRVLIVPLWN